MPEPEPEPPTDAPVTVKRILLWLGSITAVVVALALLLEGAERLAKDARSLWRVVAPAADNVAKEGTPNSPVAPGGATGSATTPPSNVVWPSGASSILSVNGDGCLDAPGLHPPTDSVWTLRQYPCEGGANQRWTFQMTSANNVVIHSLANPHYCWDLPNGSTTEHTPVHLYPCHGGMAQQWNLGQVRNDERSVEIQPALERTMCLDVTNGIANAEAEIQLSPCHHGPNQRWTFRN